MVIAVVVLLSVLGAVAWFDLLKPFWEGWSGKLGVVGAVLSIVAAIAVGIMHKLKLTQLKEDHTFYVAAIVISCVMLFLVFVVSLDAAQTWNARRLTHEKELSVREVRILVKDQNGRLLREPFKVSVQVPDRALETLSGHDGSANVSAVPRSIAQLSEVDVEYRDYEQVSKPPFKIEEGGVVTVQMVHSKKQEPMLNPTKPPPLPTFTDAGKARFSKDSAKVYGVGGEDVIVRARNVTSDDLTLLMEDLTNRPKNAVNPDGSLHVGGPGGGGVESRKLPRSEDGVVYEDFKDGSGWYFFWVRGESGKEWPLGDHNIFTERKVFVTVQDARDPKEGRYELNFSPFGEQTNGGQNTLDGGSNQPGDEPGSSSGSTPP
jgi:hypothetical protein